MGVSAVPGGPAVFRWSQHWCSCAVLVAVFCWRGGVVPLRRPGDVPVLFQLCFERVLGGVRWPRFSGCWFYDGILVGSKVASTRTPRSGEFAIAFGVCCLCYFLVSFRVGVKFDNSPPDSVINFSSHSLALSSRYASRMQAGYDHSYYFMSTFIRPLDAKQVTSFNCPGVPATGCKSHLLACPPPQRSGWLAITSSRCVLLGPV